MYRNVNISVFLGVVCLIFQGQLQACDSNVSLTKIAEDVYVRQGIHAPVFERSPVANIGFIVGQRCVAVIDSGASLAEGRALHCAIREITKLPVCYIIITHMHPDHALGAEALREAKTHIIGHANLARALSLVGPYYIDRLNEMTDANMRKQDLPIVDTNVAVGQSLELDLGQRELHLIAHPTAHTDNDLSVFDTVAEILWTGDLVFLEHMPAVDGSSSGWLKVLDQLVDIPAQAIISGHGPLNADWPSSVEPTKRYLEQLRVEVRRMIDEGVDMLTAQQRLSAEGSAAMDIDRWQLSEAFHKRNISKVYAELEWE